MSTKKYLVFDEGGLQALVNQTKANKTTAADNSAAVDDLSTDLQEMGAQITNVLGEVETCLNELDTVKADTASVNAALSNKADVSRVAALEEQVNNLSGGGSVDVQANYAQNDSAATDYIKNRPFYANESIVDFLPSTNFPFSADADMNAFIFQMAVGEEEIAAWNADWKSVNVIWDGTEYECEPQYIQGMKVIGNVAKMMGTGDSGEPFGGYFSDSGNVKMCLFGDLETPFVDGGTVTHNVSMSFKFSELVKLDPKYLENIDYETQLINKPFGMTSSGTVLLDADVNCAKEFENGMYYAMVDEIELIEGVEYIVEIDGVSESSVASYVLGDKLALETADCGLANNFMPNVTMILSTQGEHTIKITLAEDVVKKIDPIYLPESAGGSSLPEVTADDNDKVLKVVDGVWTASGETNELPNVTTSDAGKILRVNSTGAWAVGAETTELPSVTTSDNGKTLQVVNGVWKATDELSTISDNVELCSSELETVKTDVATANTQIADIVSRLNSDYVTKAELIEILNALNVGFVADESQIEAANVGLYYTVRFWDGDTLLQESQVAYGTEATPPDTGDGFIGWIPSDMTITADTDFYGEWVEVDTDIVPSQTLTFKENSYYANASGKLYSTSYPSTGAGVVGATYIVEWDGVAYTCVCRNVTYDLASQYIPTAQMSCAIGNAKIPTTVYSANATTTDTISKGEPFLIAIGASTIEIIANDKKTTHTVRIYQ